MNASDIVKAKQNQTLYKAYYKPTNFPNFTVSTVNYYPISTVSTGGGFYSTSYTSCITTQYLYQCNPPVISYQLVNDVENGEYICGGKVPSYLTWRANSSMGTQPVYTSTGSTIVSANSFAVRPLICTNPEFYQGTNFASRCEVCNNFGAGANACCHNCASGQ